MMLLDISKDDIVAQIPLFVNFLALGHNLEFLVLFYYVLHHFYSYPTPPWIFPLYPTRYIFEIVPKTY